MESDTLYQNENATIPNQSGGMVQLTNHEFNDIRKIVYDNFGINLTEQKRSLIVGRLFKLLRSYGLNSFQEYFNYIKSDTSGQAMGELINRISTNHTFFFREKEHFEFLSKVVLPGIESRPKNNSSNDLRIWCAGCSYGDEPYTYVIVMLEYFKAKYNFWDAGLLATDISEPALSAAKKGIYSSERIRLVPPDLKNKYFKKLQGDEWAVSDRLKSEITFRRLNLMNQSFPFKKQFDIISCRNVMIYFDQPTRDALVNRFYKHTTPGGYLFIGHSETLRSDSCPYEYVKPAIYRKGNA